MWLYEGREFMEDEINDYVGFVYRIKNLQSGRMYIGKKLFFSRLSKPPLKGKKRKRIIKKQSNWKEYYGSNEQLLEDVKSIGSDNFKREILRLCKTKGECNYYEAKLQFEFDVLKSMMYYNGHIDVRVHRTHLKE